MFLQVKFFLFIMMFSGIPVLAKSKCSYSQDALTGKLLFERTQKYLPKNDTDYVLNLWKYIKENDIKEWQPEFKYFNEYVGCHNLWNVIASYEMKSSMKSHLRTSYYFYALDKSAMINYAKAYAKGSNHQYPVCGWFGSEDCTNFASQILHAGQVPMVYWSQPQEGDKNGNSWYMRKLGGYGYGCTSLSWLKLKYSLTWTVVDMFRMWVTTTSRVSFGNPVGVGLYISAPVTVPVSEWGSNLRADSQYWQFVSKLNEYLVNGVGFWQIDYDNDGKYNHTVFLFKQNGSWWFAYHSSDTLEKLSTLWQMAKNGDSGKQRLFKYRGVILRIEEIGGGDDVGWASTGK